MFLTMRVFNVSFGRPDRVKTTQLLSYRGEVLIKCPVLFHRLVLAPSTSPTPAPISATESDDVSTYLLQHLEAEYNGDAAPGNLQLQSLEAAIDDAILSIKKWQQVIDRNGTTDQVPTLFVDQTARSCTASASAVLVELGPKQIQKTLVHNKLYCNVRQQQPQQTAKISKLSTLYHPCLTTLPTYKA